MATGRLPDPNTAPVTAKGDLYTYSTVPAKLAVGNNGETLVADSSASVGLRYQEPKAGNPVINSAFQVWQRGTSVSVAASTAAYTADRWLLSTGVNAAHTVSRQSTGDTTNLPNIQYCARIQRNSGQTGANQQGLYHMFETVNSIPFAGKTVTVSFYARKGADFSPTSSNITFALYTGTGTDQNLATAGYTGQAAPGSTTASLTATWTRYSFTATIAATATELSLFAYWTTVGTASTNDYLEITGVQLEVGSVATPFKTQGVTLAGELAACQRYFQRFGDGVTNEMIGLGLVTGNIAYVLITHPVQLRGTPSLSNAANANFVITNGVTTVNPTAINADVLSSKVSSIGVSFGTTVTAGTVARWYRDGTDAAFVDFSSEL